MNRILKISVRYFLLVFITYGVLISLLNLFTERDFSFQEIIEGCLIFGLGMTVILVAYHRYEVKAIAKQYGISNPDLDVKQSRKIKSKIELSTIFDQLQRRNYYRKIVFDKEADFIKIKTGFIGKSWGDIITIEKLKNDRYRLSSRPRFPLTAIDFGQNLENILLLEHRICVFEKKTFDSEENENLFDY